MDQTNVLPKTLGIFTIWGLGVGYVISGMYFGWNLGLPYAGTYGFLLAILVVSIMYIAFVLSYAELACALPKAGGAFVYALEAFGSKTGFIAGIAQVIEFVFAPPAIAAAIGAYFSLFFANSSPMLIAIAAYVFFTAFNIYGVKQSAIFELGITILAVGELFIFAGLTTPHFTWTAFSQNPWPENFGGILQAIPFAIWFYLAIEGIANIAEESKNPQKDIGRGFILAMGTLVLLALLVFFTAVGVGGWEQVVYPAGSEIPSDSPLPLALFNIVGDNNFYYHLLISIGLFGLIASFHGIILAAGRATFELGRAQYLPKNLGKLFDRTKTPATALIINMLVGIVALLSGRTGEIIILAVFGALTLYFISMLSFFKLRLTQPQLIRPFRTPLVPLLPATALVLSGLFLLSMCFYHPQIACVYFSLLTIAFIYYHFFVPEKVKQTLVITRNYV
ncbi:MAG: ethanolamine permease [bacterium]|nr:ethanolamine permease [bacterium]